MWKNMQSKLIDYYLITIYYYILVNIAEHCKTLVSI